MVYEKKRMTALRKETKFTKNQRFVELKSEFREEEALANVNLVERAIKENTSFYRRRLGLTQEQLAEILGISRIHVANIESLNMDKVPSRELEYRIAEALQITPQDLETPLGVYKKAPTGRSL